MDEKQPRNETIATRPNEPDPDDEDINKNAKSRDDTGRARFSNDEPQQENIVEEEEDGQIHKAGQMTVSKDVNEDAPLEPIYSSFGPWEKRFIVFAATMGAFFSPFTAQIYFPALTSIANDLHVSDSKINLTMTTYMVSRYPFSV